MKTIKYEDIKTPSTLEEFRNNLKKYFVCYVSIRTTYVRVRNTTLKLMKLQVLADLYKCKV